MTERMREREREMGEKARRFIITSFEVIPDVRSFLRDFIDRKE